jgi:cation diffusion facilitator family transporter
MTKPVEVQEKKRAARASVVAGLLLTGMKLVAAVATASLGLLAETIHSAMDTIAAAMTWFAVRESWRPPDREHQYGHSKFENLAALFETLLLVVTSFWILYEAIRRLRGGGPHVEPTSWAFVVMAASIVVDFYRSRDLDRVARESSSQALEADALHFKTDIASSAVVLVGLACVLAARATGRGWLALADPVAAIVVAIIVLRLSWRLGRKAVDMLVDRAPADTTRLVEEALSGLPGLEGSPRARVRTAGDKTFADLVLPMKPGMPVAEGDRIAASARARVREAVGENASVHVELEAKRDASGSLHGRVQTAVAAEGEQAHDITIRLDRAGYQADLHLELPGRLTLGEAHAVADRVEERIRREVPEIHRVDIHLELQDEDAEPASRLDDAARASLEKRIQAVAKEVGVGPVHDVLLTRTPAGIYLSCHCELPARTPLAEAHERTDWLEERLLLALPELTRIAVHAEPREP